MSIADKFTTACSTYDDLMRDGLRAMRDKNVDDLRDALQHIIDMTDSLHAVTGTSLTIPKR